MKSKLLISISVSVALLMVVTAVYFRFGSKLDLIPAVSQKEIIHPEGEDHEHARLLIFINNKQLDIGELHYMERDERAHLHDNDGTIIHLHVSEISLSEFFKTLDMKLTSECFHTDKSENYCSNASSTLSVFVNKNRLNTEVDRYMVRNYDKILINYGSDSMVDLGLKMNALENLGNRY